MSKYSNFQVQIYSYVVLFLSCLIVSLSCYIATYVRGVQTAECKLVKFSIQNIIGCILLGSILQYINSICLYLSNYNYEWMKCDYCQISQCILHPFSFPWNCSHFHLSLCPSTTIDRYNQIPRTRKVRGSSTIGLNECKHYYKTWKLIKSLFTKYNDVENRRYNAKVQATWLPPFSLLPSPNIVSVRITNMNCIRFFNFVVFLILEFPWPCDLTMLLY